MTDLIVYAKTLATNPPTKVYKKLMQLFSKEQLAMLGAPPFPDPDGRKQRLYDKTKAECEALANNWDQMISNPDYGKYAADIARFSVTAICDFVAMCMMMIAAGSARVENLKAAILGQNKAGAFETKSKDRAYLINSNDSRQFLSVMKTWCGLQNNGIVQFKFVANSDFHTFAVERAPGKNEQPEFIVYQAYQNTYSLSHFLKVQDVWTDDALDRIRELRWEAMTEEGKNAYQNNYKTYGLQVLVPEIDNIEFTMKWIGDGQRLTYQDLNLRVLRPLAGMLHGTTSRRDYVRMTGSHSTSQTFRAPYMVVLMCDQVSPQEYQANCGALYDCPADLTKYPECSMGY